MNSLKIYTLILSLSIGAVMLAIKLAPETKNQSPAAIGTTIPLTYEEQFKEEANVTLRVKPLVLEQGKQPKFEVSFDTHSVNLDFDVATSAILTNNFGVALGPAIWQGTPAGGHHRSGMLTFERPLDNSVNQIFLTFKNIAGVPDRIFDIQTIK